MARVARVERAGEYKDTRYSSSTYPLIHVFLYETAYKNSDSKAKQIKNSNMFFFILAFFLFMFLGKASKQLDLKFSGGPRSDDFKKLPV